MPRGSAPGERRGGRAKGVPNKRTQLIAQQAAQAGITPIEVLLGAMRQAWEEGDLDKACERAASAAPYVHPRLAAVESKQEVVAQVTHWPLPKTPLDEVPTPDGV